MEERELTRKDRVPLAGEVFPERLSQRRRWREPVLYVPGFLRLNAFSAAMPRKLRDLDFEVYTMLLPFLGVGDIRRGARALTERMEALRVLLGVRRLSLIGHGLGGLIARYAIERMGAGDYLARLIMMGTPNHGTCSSYPFFFFRAARQALPRSRLLSELNAAHRGALESGTGFPYISLYTSQDLAVIPWTSCRLEGADNLKVGWFCTHMGLARSDGLLGLLAGWLEGGEVETHKGAWGAEDTLLSDLTQSLEMEPHEEGDVFRRGQLLLDRGYYGWAVRDLTRFIKMRPDLPEAYMLRGKALRRKMSYGENPIYNRAIRDFGQVIKIKPGWAEAYYERGVCYALLNAWSDAMDNWDRALILNRDLYPAHLARGLGRMKRGDIAGAAEDFYEVLRIQPDEPEALRFLSEMGR